MLLSLSFRFALSLSLGISAPNQWITDDPGDYHLVQKLASIGLCDDLLWSDRPWSRAEFQRITKESRTKLLNIERENSAPDFDVQAAEGILSQLETRYQSEELGAVVENLQVEAVYADLKSRSIPENNGAGEIRGDVLPLSAYRSGQVLERGFNTTLKAQHSAFWKPYFSLHFSPRLENFYVRNGENTGDNAAGFKVERLYGKLSWRNIELQVGRDQLIWGHGESGGVGFTTNSLPLDLLKVSSISPFYHPWIFRYLGPSKYSFFVARMEGERETSHPFLYGLKLSFKPAKLLELSVSETMFMGGDGPKAGDPDWFEHLLQFFNLAHGPLDPHTSVSSDHRLAAEARIRIPPLAKAEIYVETLFEDMSIGTFALNFTERMAFSTGIFFPWLGHDGKQSLNFEYRRIPPLVFRHSQFLDGYVRYRRPLGYEAGPDSDTLEARYRLKMNRVLSSSFKASYEVSRAHSYLVHVTSAGGSGDVERISEFPEEKRFRILPSLSFDLSSLGFSLWSVQSQFGFERITNFNFESGRNQNQWLVGAAFTRTLW